MVAPSLTDPSVARSWSRSCPAIVALASSFVLIALSRGHSWDEPPVRDVATYAVVAHEMLEGRVLYAEVWDFKPPGIFLIYVGVELLVGYGPQVLYAAGVLGATAALAGIFTSASVRGRSEGLFAAVGWALVSTDLRLEANEANTEVFLSACLAFSLSLLLRSSSKPRRRRLLALGLLFAAGSLIKQVVVVAAATMVAYWAAERVWSATDRGAAIRTSLSAIATLAAIGLGAWGLCLAVFASLGHLDEMLATVFGFAEAYARHGLLPGVTDPTFFQLGMALIAGLHFPTTSPIFWPLGLLTLGGTIFGVKRHDRQWSLLGAWLLAVPFMVALPGRSFPHYEQLWLPPLCIGSAWCLGDLRRVLGKRITAAPLRDAIGPAMRIALIVALAAIEVPSFTLSTEAQSIRKHGDLFVRTRRVAEEIDRHLGDSETFYFWGPGASLHFASRRRPPSGVFLHFPLRQGPLRGRLTRQVLADLQENPPALVVLPVPNEQSGRPPKPIIDWIRANYRPDPTNPSRDPEFRFFWQRGKVS